MKEMTKKELILLGKDLKIAKVLVLLKHGFSVEEISAIVGIPEASVRKLSASAEETKK